MSSTATTLMSPEFMAGRGLTASVVASGPSGCPDAVHLPSNLSIGADVTTTDAATASWPTYALTVKHRTDSKPGFITVIDHRLTRRPLERAP